MKKVYDYLLNSIKLNEKDIVILGCSSGPDSMALLYILWELRKKINFKIVVAHVNHNIRLESKEEASFLEKFCNDKDIIFEYMKISKYSDDNFHNEARNIRYSFYNSLIEKYNANYLMTGHHGDDLIETMLMRMVRGSSFKGYAGFSSCVEMNGYKIVRPLIFVTKDDIENFNKSKNIPYRIDKSNFKDKYTRNRYRMEILPFLKQEDKNVHEKFWKFSKTLLEYDEFLDSLMFKSIEMVYNNGVITIEKFKKLPIIMQKRIADYLFEKIYLDDLILITDKHLELFFSLINSKKANLSYNLPNDYMLIKSYDIVYFKKIIDDINVYDMPLEDFVRLPNGMTIERIDSCDNNGNDIFRVCCKDVVMPLRVRTRKNGDRIKTLNGGTKKVKDVFIDKKIPLDKRDSWPVVVDSLDRVVWIPNLKKSKFNRLKSESCDIIFRCC